MQLAAAKSNYCYVMLLQVGLCQAQSHPNRLQMQDGAAQRWRDLHQLMGHTGVWFIEQKNTVPRVHKPSAAVAQPSLAACAEHAQQVLLGTSRAGDSFKNVKLTDCVACRTHKDCMSGSTTTWELTVQQSCMRCVLAMCMAHERLCMSCQLLCALSIMSCTSPYSVMRLRLCTAAGVNMSATALC